MAGRNTAKNGPHPSGGGWVADYRVEICSEAIARLSGALGRKLNRQEVLEIEHGLAIQLSIRASQTMEPSRQSVKRTLAHIAGCADEDVHDAYRICDTTTGVEIDCALSAAGIHESSAASPAAIQSAARAALVSLGSLKPQGGAPTKGYHQMLAEWCVRLWKYYGQTKCAVWFKDESGECSPLLTWTVTLFSIVECRSFDRRKCERLLRAALRQGKVSTA